MLLQPFSKSSCCCSFLVFAMRLATMIPEVGRNTSDDVTSSLLNMSFAGSTSYQDDVMDSGDSSSARPTNYAGGGEATVSSFITFIILLAGVVGGLIIVVLVIVFCKYCVQGKKQLKRSQRDGSREGGRPVRMLQRYETINSEVLSEPSTASLDGIPLSPRKTVDISRNRGRRDDSEEANERTHLRTSYEKDHMYDHQTEAGSFRALNAGSATGSPSSRKSATGDLKDEAEEGAHRPPGSKQDSGAAGASAGSLSGSRRVSFQLEEKISRQDSQSSRSSRRYTEGDFHHLKYAKITALPRQYSLTVPPISIGSGPSSAPIPRPMPSLGATASDTAFRYSLDERLRILQQDAEKSFPPIQQPQPPPPAAESPKSRASVSPQRSPRARAGSRASSQEGTLTVNSASLEAGGVSRLRLSPSPPRFQRTGGDRWRRTPSASPSPPGEPVHRQINVEVHYQQGEEAQGGPSNTVHEPVPQRYVPKHEMLKQHSVGGLHDNKKQYHAPIHDNSRKHAAPARDNAYSKHHLKSAFSHDSGATSVPKHHKVHENSRKQYSVPAYEPPPKNHHQHSNKLPPSNDVPKYHLHHNVPRHVQRTHAYQQKPTSHSLELVESRRRAPSAAVTRKVKSYEDVADYDVLQITEFSRGPFYNTDFDVISELASPTSSKVRYNDTGSLEELQEEAAGEVSCLALEALLPPDDTNSDDTATLNGSHQNRELWHLRATLEEEEECSDTIRMEDGTSPDDSPDREHAQTTSFESTVPSDACASDQRDSGIQWEGRIQADLNHQRGPRPAPMEDRPPHHRHQHHPYPHGNGNGGGGVAQLLHPNYENRRQTYRNMLSGRLARSPAGPGVAAVLGSASADNSFDSVETDGDVSDTSRHEVTTTSFESTTTTDNTDSTTESQHSRLRQMKTDSGYKSLETQQSGVREAGEAHEVIEPEDRNMDRMELRGEAGGDYHEARRGGNGSGVSQGNAAAGRAEVSGGRRNSNAIHFERRAGRTASKKRREYSRERQVIHVCDSMHEPETDSIRSDVPSGDSFDDSSQRRQSHAINHHQHHHYSMPQAPTCKRSIFTRFFSYGHGREKYMVRDYSIDEKTNQIFNEFLRQEIPDDGSIGSAGSSRLGLRRSPRSQHRPRLQRKHTEPLYRLEDRRRDRLAPEMRSASLGSDSSASSVRRLSPQDSIEEEYEEEELDKGWRRTELAPMMEVTDTDGMEGDVKSSMFSSSSSSKAVHGIPIIKLPEGELQNAS